MSIKLPDSEKNNPNRYKIAFDYYESFYKDYKQKDINLLGKILAKFSDSEIENLVEREPYINYFLGLKFLEKSNLEMAANYFHKIPADKIIYDEYYNYLNLVAFRRLANIYLDQELPNPKLTLKYYDIVCKMGDTSFCLDFKKAEEMYYNPDGLQFKDKLLISRNNTINLMKIFAAQGNSEALYIIADSEDKWRYNEKSLTIFKKLAAEGHLKSTYRLAKYYESGTLIKQDLQKAKSIYGHICDKGYKPACVDYKRINEKGF